MDPLTIRTATLYDASLLAPRLRQEDVREIAESSGHTPLESLLGAVRSSRWSRTVVGSKGAPMALFGVVAASEGVGVPWLLMDDDALESASPLWIHRQALRQLSEMHEEFPLLYNVVSARNTAPILWLDSLGFKFTVIHPRYGVAGMPFLQFERTEHV